MNIDKKQVSDWLKKYNHTREWLSNQCQVTKRTVDNWLSSPQKIPAKAIPIIHTLIATDEERTRIEDSVPQNLVLEFNRKDFDAICDRAIQTRQRPNQWAEEQLRNLANENMDELTHRLQDLKAAEDKAPYNQKPNSDVPEAG